jgi:hypothetical protein
MINLDSRARSILFLIGVVLASGFLGLAKSSRVVTSWRNPDAPSSKFHKVLALGLSEKTTVRADFEDALASQLTGAGLQATPGNTILLRPEGTHLDLNYLRSQVRSNQFEAVVVSRLIKVEKKVTYVPGGPSFMPYPYYGTFYGYYSTVYPIVYTPDYLREEKKVRIETNLYLISDPDGVLVWTAVTDTFNPSDVDKAIGKLVKLVVKQMQTDNVL